MHDTLEKWIRKEKPLEEMCLDEQMTGDRSLSLQYRSFDTISFIKCIEKVEVPIRPILLIRKPKTVLPSLSALIEKNISSNVIYKRTCNGCSSSYIGFTIRCAIIRKNEHIVKRGLLEKHFNEWKENLNQKLYMEVFKCSN